MNLPLIYIFNKDSHLFLVLCTVSMFDTYRSSSNIQILSILTVIKIFTMFSSTNYQIPLTICSWRILYVSVAEEHILIGSASLSSNSDTDFWI